jgi:hypothetical protein
MGGNDMANDRKRRLEIIKRLSDLSRDGWRYASPYDYKPLESELRAIEAKRPRKESDNGKR